MIITYYSYKTNKPKIMKCLKSKYINPANDFTWDGFDFDIELSKFIFLNKDKDDFYLGEIHLEFYSKEIVKDKLIGNIILNVQDDIM